MPKPFVLTQRDVDILQSLSQVRYLTVQHLQWLHWTARWREYERAAREAGAVNRRPNNAYVRAAGLVNHGLLVAIQRTAERAVTTYKRLPLCLSLTHIGAEALACERGMVIDQLLYDERSARSATTLEHSLGIGAFYAALRAELEYRSRSLDDWASDQVLCTDYDSVVVAGVGHALPIIPDATFVLDGQRYFVEVDRGTTRLEQWRKKALAYDAYQRDPRLAERFGATNAIILVISPPGKRLLAVARTIAAVHGGVTNRYRFLAEERVHPFSIRRRWQQIDRVTFPSARRSSEGGLPQVTFSDAVLWNPLPGEGSL